MWSGFSVAPGGVATCTGVPWPFLYLFRTLHRLVFWALLACRAFSPTDLQLGDVKEEATGVLDPGWKDLDLSLSLLLPRCMTGGKLLYPSVPLFHGQNDRDEF